MYRLLSAVFVLVSLLFAAAPLTWPASIEGVTFKEHITVNGRRLHLHGTALLKHLIVIKAYVGGLYLANGVATDRVLSDVPKALVLNYFHEIPAENFAKATTTMIEKNVSKSAFQNLKPRIDQMNALYRSVSPGDEYQAAYIPGAGTSLALNGKELGIVPGSKFAFAYFSIWLGEKPISKSFRDVLLGK